MAIAHARPVQPIAVRPLGARLAEEKTVALFKSEHLEVMRLVLLAGRSLPPHKVPGEITVQCIEGTLQISAGDRTQVLCAGELLYLSGGVMHGVTAVQDCSALVTIALRK